MKTQSSRRANARAQRVHFELTAPAAQSVCIAGTFNDWHPSASEMIHLGDGRWAKDLILPHGIHEYRFVVDGEWLTDPRAQETVPNPFGSQNAVVKLNGKKGPP